MALVCIESIANGTQLGIWKKEEPIDLLESVFILNQYEENDYVKISNEGRKKEWLSTRILLTEMLQMRTTIKYNENKKPYIENHNSNISISHSRNFVVIIISAHATPGIDVEHVSTRVEKVKHKFLMPEELEWCTTLDQMTACWSAKEAVFKIFEKDLDFHDMVVSRFNLSSLRGSFKVSVIKKGKKGEYLVKYRQIENDIITYTMVQSPIN